MGRNRSLHKKSWPDFVEKTDLLPKPYFYGLNPGTLYYWDVYFHNEGLMRHGHMDIAQNNLDCMIYEIDMLGFIPTAMEWGTNRSQLPFFSHTVRRFYEKSQDTAWLRTAYGAVRKEYEFWTNENGNNIEDHTTPIPGLQRYSHHADSAELIEFYDRVLFHRFPISKDVPVEEKLAMADQMMAETECQDFTPRFAGRCMDFIPVCLNAYLYGYEKDLAFYEQELGMQSTVDWEKRAADRAALIEQYCWDEERGFYFDYDFVNERHSKVASLYGIMPLFFEMSPRSKAKRVRDNMVLFDSEGGLVSCEITPGGEAYQFGHNAVWPPTQQLGMETMQRYGFLYEKYTRSGDINDIEYSASHMLGWAGSAFLVAREIVEQ